MGLRIEIAEGEQIGKALRRLKRLANSVRLHEARHLHFIKPSEERRHRKNVEKDRKRAATFLERMSAFSGRPPERA
jgi:ribosomal protein S21